ncbi:hypothetical protein N7456_007606 [Penicillium angulare]|uniref:Ankyrin n=1 Tax=Penicillium angulare TaxID=116970 RepID=A0A9W9K8J6_9EURO|nr:hypothetical protein N7456_007606 [Penicillium angulare]
MAQQEYPMTTEEEATMRDNLIDVWILGGKCCAWHALGPPADLDGWYAPSGRIDYTAALACSAALRGNCDELQDILDCEPRRREIFYGKFQGQLRVDILNHSSDFGQVRSLEVASETGTADIMKRLTSNECDMDRAQQIWFRKYFLAMTARAGNWNGLKALVEFIRSHPRLVAPGLGLCSLAWRFRPAIRGALRGRNFDILDLLSHELADEVDMIEFNFEVLMQAIISGKVDAVKYALRRRDVDVNGRHINNYKYSPLFTALYDSPITPKLPIMTLLLENGADVHQGNSKTGETLMECAVAKGCNEIVKLIVDHESKLPGSQQTSPYIKRRREMLQTAVRYKSASLIEILFMHNQHLFYSQRKRTFTVRREGQAMGDSEKRFSEIEGQGEVVYIVTVHQNKEKLRL